MSPSPEGQASAGRGSRIEVDRKRCEGHGLCVRKAPELLRHDENGELVIDAHELGGGALEAARAAVRVCPVAALRLI
jgi:ferredoxin